MVTLTPNHVSIDYCSDWDGSDTLPRAIWAQLQQNISFIVSKFRGVQVACCWAGLRRRFKYTDDMSLRIFVQSVYKIVHSQFLDGVKRRYLNDMEQRERIYEKLVDFYRSKGLLIANRCNQFRTLN